MNQAMISYKITPLVLSCLQKPPLNPQLSLVHYQDTTTEGVMIMVGIQRWPSVLICSLACGRASSP